MKSLFFPLLIALFLFAGPASVVRAIEPRSQLRQHLEREGYIGEYKHGQGLQRGVSSYLWDHRQQLKTINFHNLRQEDALVCLMIRSGYGGFVTQAEDQVFMRWCETILK